MAAALLANATRRSLTTAAAPAFNAVTVYGSGLMGAGIVQVSAQAGYKVTMVDVNKDALTRGEKIILSSLGRIAKKAHPEAAQARSFIDSIMANITMSTDTAGAVANADLVIEAIVENIAVKQSLFKILDQTAPQHTVFTSNTSSLAIRDIASATNRKDRFAGLHFFNPVPQMKLVEVVRTDETLQSVFNGLLQFCQKLNKSPVSCKDTPGFIVNRLLVPYLAEAMRIVERGEATVQDIDSAMKLGAGYPMGPFELADYVGLDTSLFILEGWHKNGAGLRGDKLVEPPKLLRELVKQGKLGRKSGSGFYEYAK